MRKFFILLVISSIGLLIANFSLAQDKQSKDAKRVLLLRQAQERKKTIVAVEAHLIGDVLEATISARMYAAKPKIFNAVIIGPKLGRLSPKSRKMLFATTEEEELFPTEDLEGGLIRFSKKKEEKIAKGTLTKELMKFKIPPDKIASGREYKLWIKIEGMQGKVPIQTFKFGLEKLSQLILQ